MITAKEALAYNTTRAKKELEYVYKEIQEQANTGCTSISVEGVSALSDVTRGVLKTNGYDVQIIETKTIISWINADSWREM